MTRRVPIAALALFLPLVATAARAQGPASVSLQVERCETGAFDALAVIDAARVELAADGIPDVHAAATDDDGALARIHVVPDCADATTYVVRVEDLVTHKSVERTITLDGMPSSAAPRALAIAIAELLRASWAELEIADAPSDAPAVVEALRVRVRGLREARGLTEPSPPRPPTPEPTRVEPTAPTGFVAVGAQGVVRAFPSGGVAPAGGRLVLDLPVVGGVRLSIEGEVVFGTAVHPLGVVDLGLASGGVTLRYDATIDVLRLGLGVRAAGGGGWTQGHPTSAVATGAAGGGFVLLVGGVIAADLRLADAVSAHLDVEGGGAAVGFQAYVDATPVAGLLGGYLAFALGLALAL